MSSLKIRDRPLEKLWGDMKLFQRAKRFFRVPCLCRTFFRTQVLLLPESFKILTLATISQQNSNSNKYILTFTQSFCFSLKIILGGAKTKQYQTHPSAIAQSGAALLCFGLMFSQVNINCIDSGNIENRDSGNKLHSWYARVTVQ